MNRQQAASWASRCILELTPEGKRKYRVPHSEGALGEKRALNQPTVHPTQRNTTSAGRGRVDFKNPPVIETILGVQFVPLRGLTLPYIGLYWSEIRDRYPSQEVKPPLSQVIEDFSSPPAPAKVGFEIFDEPDARFWFIDQSSTQLIQIQRDRFIRNWRKGEPPHNAYPRYDELRPRFEHDWLSFVGFLERERLGTPEVNQCEVTYINHIELGIGWSSLGDAHRVLTMLKHQDRPEFLPEPEMLIVSGRYVIPEWRGRLHVSAQPAIRRRDGRQVMQLTLTARGKPDSSRLSDIVTWFDLGHDWIVHGFVDVTSAEMHHIWGRL